jgi:hypothetical protein
LVRPDFTLSDPSNVRDGWRVSFCGTQEHAFAAPVDSMAAASLRESPCLVMVVSLSRRGCAFDVAFGAKADIVIAMRNVR